MMEALSRTSLIKGYFAVERPQAVHEMLSQRLDVLDDDIVLEQRFEDASPAHRPRGLPPKVDPCVPGTNAWLVLSVASSARRHARAEALARP